jgi:hypothetical protein
MAKREGTGKTVAILGGAALAVWLLSRGKGSGVRGPGDVYAAGTTRPSRCVVWIRSDGLSVDGVAADLSTVIAQCRAAGEAEVHATGGAITGVVWETLKALREAGVTIYAAPNLENTLRTEPR